MFNSIKRIIKNALKLGPPPLPKLTPPLSSKLQKNYKIRMKTTENMNNFREFVESRENKGNELVITHSGKFHCDEVMACVLIKHYLHYMYKQNICIVRTRNPDIIQGSKGILIDVGGQYCLKDKKFDHHQRNFNGYIYIYIYMILERFSEDYKFIMSSTGLIYKNYGLEIIEGTIREWNKEEKCTKAEDIKSMHSLVYDRLIGFIDGDDNGISYITDSGEQTPNYRITTTISDRIKRLNKLSKDNIGFRRSMDICEEELLFAIYTTKNTLASYENIRKAYLDRKLLHQSGKLMFLESRSRVLGYKESIFAIEEEFGELGQIHFIIFRDIDQYRVMSVPIKLGYFENRKVLKEEWRGLEEEELQNICKLNSAKFVHSTGFMGVAGNKEDAMQMAILSLDD